MFDAWSYCFVGFQHKLHVIADSTSYCWCRKLFETWSWCFTGFQHHLPSGAVPSVPVLSAQAAKWRPAARTARCVLLSPLECIGILCLFFKPYYVMLNPCPRAALPTLECSLFLVAEPSNTSMSGLHPPWSAVSDPHSGVMLHGRSGDSRVLYST